MERLDALAWFDVGYLVYYGSGKNVDSYIDTVSTPVATT